MFELHLANNNVDSGTIAVSWCLDKEALEILTSKGIKDPVVVLCVAPVDNYALHKEVRHVVPLSDLIGYIGFQCAGKNKVWGFISAWSNSVTRGDYLCVRHDEYRTSILNDGEEFSSVVLSDVNETFIAAPLEIDIPSEAFAKEPPAWEAAWINLWYRDPPKDQCAYRRRRLFGYSLKPVLFALLMFVRLFFVIGAFLYGSRDFSLQSLLHPLRTEMYEVVKMLFDSETIFIGQGESKFWNYARLPFMPLIAILWIGLAIALIKLHVFATGIGIILGAGGILVVAYTILKTAESIIDHRELVKLKAPAWYLNEDEADLIICSGQPRFGSFWTLPKKHRTFKLFAQDLKSKVCRPFSN